MRSELQHRHGTNQQAHTNVSRQEDLEERCDEVVDPLHIPARRVPDSPDIKDPLEALQPPRTIINLVPPHPPGEWRPTYALGTAFHPESDTGPCAGHVNLNLVPYLLVEAFFSASKAELYERGVFLALASKG
jgi:hypothetical protein